MDRIFEIFIGAGIEIMEKIEEIESASSKMEITGMGADGTPTRYIDKASEDIFLKTVYENDLPYNVVSEEAGFIDRKYNQNLVVDPIDGTLSLIGGCHAVKQDIQPLRNPLECIVKDVDCLQ